MEDVLDHGLGPDDPTVFGSTLDDGTRPQTQALPDSLRNGHLLFLETDEFTPEGREFLLRMSIDRNQHGRPSKTLASAPRHLREEVLQHDVGKAPDHATINVVGRQLDALRIEPVLLDRVHLTPRHPGERAP